MTRRGALKASWLVLGLILWLPGATGVCAADIVGDIIALQPLQPHTYVEFISVARELAGCDRITAERIGYTG